MIPPDLFDGPAGRVQAVQWQGDPTDAQVLIDTAWATRYDPAEHQLFIGPNMIEPGGWVVRYTTIWAVPDADFTAGFKRVR